jgi:hypothetical protein
MRPSPRRGGHEQSGSGHDARPRKFGKTYRNLYDSFLQQFQETIQ